jgi:hypothetical protein
MVTQMRRTGSKRPKQTRTGALRSSDLETRMRTLDTIHLMRSQGRTLSSAAREVGISPASAIHYAHGAIYEVGGRYRVRPHDTLRRDLVFYDSEGQITVETHSSETASDIGRYHNAVREYLIYGDDTALLEFEGKSVIADGGKYRYITDRRTLNRLARAGELNFLEIYKH